MLNRGLTKRIIIENEHNKIIAIGAGPKALLAAQTMPDAGLDPVLIEMDKSIQKNQRTDLKYNDIFNYNL